MRARMRWLLLLIALSVGCSTSPPRGEVEGVVKRNGQPVGNVLVVFLPEPDSGVNSIRSTAVADAQGRYRLRGEDKKPGAAVGWHRVVVEDMAVYSAPRDSDGTVLSKPPARFPAKYSNPLRSPLRKQVQVGPQVIELDLAN